MNIEKYLLQAETVVSAIRLGWTTAKAVVDLVREGRAEYRNAGGNPIAAEDVEADIEQTAAAVDAERDAARARLAADHKDGQ